jgi:hypothetical protein
MTCWKGQTRNVDIILVERMLFENLLIIRVVHCEVHSEMLTELN